MRSGYLASSSRTALSLNPSLPQQPWLCFELLTYGFLHDPNSIGHILFNMLFLWMFGRDLEGIYGPAEFLRIYLVAIVVSGLAWLGISAVAGGATLEGASGGVMAIMMLFVLHFPRRTFLFWGILPIPAWALGGLFVLGDLSGMADQTDNVAHVCIWRARRLGSSTIRAAGTWAGWCRDG